MAYTMTVNDLFEKVTQLTADGDIKEQVNYYKETVDFYGEENQHIRNKYNNVKGQTYYVGRKEDNYLKGDELVYGDNLFFYYCGHDGFGCVRNFDSKEELERWVYRYGKPKQTVFYNEKIGIFRVTYQDGEFIEVIDYINQ